MRSRYSAYVRCDEAYLLRTWHVSTRPENLDLVATNLQWLRLEVMASNSGTPIDSEGSVEFTAYFKLQNKHQKIHEVSRFVKEQQQWFYISGAVT